MTLGELLTSSAPVSLFYKMGIRRAPAWQGCCESELVLHGKCGEWHLAHSGCSVSAGTQQHPAAHLMPNHPSDVGGISMLFLHLDEKLAQGHRHGNLWSQTQDLNSDNLTKSSTL